MEPAINEVLSALSAQNLSPVGPLFAHHLTQDDAVFDFEVGFPVSCEIEPTGRVKNSVLPAGDAVYTSYVGSYDGLFRGLERVRSVDSERGRPEARPRAW